MSRCCDKPQRGEIRDPECGLVLATFVRLPRGNGAILIWPGGRREMLSSELDLKARFPGCKISVHGEGTAYGPDS